MTICCQRRDDQMPLINESPDHAVSWKGHLVSFHCGGHKRGHASIFSLSLIALSIASLASVVLSKSNYDDEWSQLPVEGWASLIGLGIIVLTSIVLEGISFGGKKPRICISPALLVTAAMVASCTTLLVMRGYADHEISRFTHNQKWVNETNRMIRENCDSIVSIKQQNWTSDDCALCDETSGTLDTFMNGPYLSTLSNPTILEVKENIEECNLPQTRMNVTLSANRSESGRNYLCGLPFTTTIVPATSTKLEDECLYRYISERFCIFPPLELKGDASSKGLSLGGFSTVHISVLDRCLPENTADACFPYRKSCDTAAATAFFDQIQNEYAEVKNQTLPYPAESYKVLTLTRALVVPAILITTAFTALAAFYEVFMFKGISTQSWINCNPHALRVKTLSKSCLGRCFVAFVTLCSDF